MSLPLCNSFTFHEDVITVAHGLILRQALRRCEAAVYLAGHADGTNFIVDTLAIPHQEAFSLEEGCGLLIPGSEYTRLGTLVAEVRRDFCGQLHSHPEDAFHSPTDDANPTMRFGGALSVVIPRFGTDGMIVKDMAVFRFDLAKPGWRRWSPREVHLNLRTTKDGEALILGLD